MRPIVLALPLLAAATQLPVGMAAAATAPSVDGLRPPAVLEELAVPHRASVHAQAVGGGDADVDVRDNSFSPGRLEIEVGDTVVWTQSGSNPHTVTASDGSFDSHPDCSELGTGACMGQGDTFSHTFNSPGEVRYFCRPHEEIGMTGVIVVKAKSTPPPAADTEPPPADTDAGDEAETTGPTLPDTGAAAVGGLVTGGLLLAAGALVLVRSG